VLLPLRDLVGPDYLLPGGRLGDLLEAVSADTSQRVEKIV
jgi:hypothetical protein